ncbi:MAG: Mu-like prophage major head subunit gpT family protein, partial [Armatimonadota bacterium]
RTAMQVTAENVALLSATVKSIYADAYKAQAGVAAVIATWLPSTQQSESYAWIGEIPSMRPFLDERTIQALKDYAYTITNRKYEATIGVTRDMLEDDQTGQIALKIRSLAEAGMEHYEQLLFELIRAGETALCFDGQPFYSAAHAIGAGAGSNLTSLPLSAANLQTVLSLMMKRTLPGGEPMNIKPTHLVVPTDLQWTAKEILNSGYYPDTITGGQKLAANTLQGALELVISPRLATGAEWHVLDASHSVKPFIIQQRVMPELQALDSTDGNSESAFLRDEFYYGVRSRDAAGFGLWQYAYKSTGLLCRKTL